MATKREVIEAALRGEGCLGRAADDEPVFVLRAHDPDGATLVSFWATARQHLIETGQKPGTDEAVVKEARQISRAMREWRETELAR